MLLPSYSGGGSGSFSGYGRRRGGGFGGASGAVSLVVMAICCVGLGVGWMSSRAHSSSLGSANEELRSELGAVRTELMSVRGKMASKIAEFQHLQANYDLMQQRLMDTTTASQRKDAELQIKEQALQQKDRDRAAYEDTIKVREGAFMKMLEDLQKQLVDSDGVVDALEKKTVQMEDMHKRREEDWHRLAKNWIQYEKDLHDHTKKLAAELAKAKNEAAPKEEEEKLPEMEPLLRAETDFGKIDVQVPTHAAHKFDPAALPAHLRALAEAAAKAQQQAPAGAGAGGTLPLNIKESIRAMTDGVVGSGPADEQPAAAVAGGQAAGGQAPVDTRSHHHDVYHADFHEGAGGGPGSEGHHGAGGHHEAVGGDEAHAHHYEYDSEYHHHQEHHADHYYGHYDHGAHSAYDPVDQEWVGDGHGDWNADHVPEHHYDETGRYIGPEEGGHAPEHGGHAPGHGGEWENPVPHREHDWSTTGESHGGHGGHHHYEDPHGGNVGHHHEERQLHGEAWQAPHMGHHAVGHEEGGGGGQAHGHGHGHGPAAHGMPGHEQQQEQEQKPHWTHGRNRYQAQHQAHQEFLREQQKQRPDPQQMGWHGGGGGHQQPHDDQAYQQQQQQQQHHHDVGHLGHDAANHQQQQAQQQAQQQHGRHRSDLNWKMRV